MQVVENLNQSGVLTALALQDLLSNQVVVLIGVIAHLTGTALQDDIAETARRLIGLGRNILNPEGGRCLSVKRVLCPARVRRIPRQFSWVDQRLVRDEIIGRCGSDALALDLFLITVADAKGLSYHSDLSISGYLSLDAGQFSRARAKLQQLGLIAFEKPVYQVLALDSPRPVIQNLPLLSSRAGGSASIGEILRRALGGRDNLV
ncbi:MAG: hypothetical protein ACRERU_08705 [Methylococcales bacterium]